MASITTKGMMSAESSQQVNGASANEDLVCEFDSQPSGRLILTYRDANGAALSSKTLKAKDLVNGEKIWDWDVDAGVSPGQASERMSYEFYGSAYNLVIKDNTAQPKVARFDGNGTAEITGQEVIAF